MVEKIGKVELILDDYPGVDLYSDGNVEDLLVEIAKTTHPSDFDCVVAREESWPVMYHFSSARQNILRHYPFTRQMKVLEIGAGCGAVTGAILPKAGQVDCVDLSKKRSMVNALRHRDADNLRIFLGNFEDVEKHIPADYDIITLIGVFEYASSYIKGAHPYEEFLKQIMRHLGPGGKILMAIENRLGLKYFAGCTEDHTGNYFEGIEGYGHTKRAKTFSKPGLEKVLEAAGAKGWRFFYPYPDYKFPTVIYSDENLPKPGSLSDNIRNFDRRRLVLFDEKEAFDSLIQDGLFPLFSNSFLVEIEG